MKSLHKIKPTMFAIPLEIQEAMAGLHYEVPDWDFRLEAHTIYYRTNSTNNAWAPLSASDIEYYQRYRIDLRPPFNMAMFTHGVS
jgi:hypothetical protein